jgi:predicted nucleic acid-binding protein
MRKLGLYLDTSVISFALSEDISDDNRNVTLKLIEEINKSKYEGFISDVVIRELGSTRDAVKRGKLLELVDSMELNEVLAVDEEIDGVADKYIEEGIIPAVYRDDALHIALTSVKGLDILVSWNFRHLVKHKTRIEVTGVNTLLGYKPIDICTPWEVIEDA